MPESIENGDPKGTAIVSEFAEDPDMVELIEMFVDELPARIEEIRTAFETAEQDRLATLTHQMKGAAPGYGFSTLGSAAGRIEGILRNASADPDPESLAASIHELISLCERVSRKAA